MRDSIYISKFISSINKDLIIESDKHSVWAYLLDPNNENKVILDGFICSTGTIIDSLDSVKDYIDQGFAPPLCKDFVNNFSIHKDLKSDKIKILENDNSIDILISGIRYLSLDFINLKSFSKAISNAGPYGFPIT